jgi:hypothetical protein
MQGLIRGVTDAGQDVVCERRVVEGGVMTAVLHKLSRKVSAVSDDPGERAEHHAREAERLLKSWWLSSHVKGQLHATLAVYYAGKHGET